MNNNLMVGEGWKLTNLSWRKSVAEANLGAHWGCWPLAAQAHVRTKFDIPDDQMAIQPWFGQNPRGNIWDAGLTGKHTVIAVDGENPNVSGRAFLVWFRMRYEPGDKVTLTTMDKNGAEEIIIFNCEMPKWDSHR